MDINVNVSMTDLFTGEKVERLVDFGNAFGFENWEKTEAQMNKNLDRWVQEVANDQHDTILKVDYWNLEPVE